MQKKNKKTIFDVAVIGGGPSGMIAAGRAAELGARVVLIEKKEKLGRKLLMTGKGRCNLSHAEFQPREFIKGFGKNGKFLLSTLSVFGVENTIDFFEKQGLKTKTERGKRIFPSTNKAHSVLGVLIKYLRKGGVSILSNTKVVSIKVIDGEIGYIFLDRKRRIKAKNYIICTGGKSYPVTGSTGDVLKWTDKLGHSIVKLKPALVPLRTKEKWVKEVQGLGLKNVEISVFQNDQRKEKMLGEALFTHFGIGGPIILKMSRKIGDFLEDGEVELGIDLKPALSFEELDTRIQRDFKKNNRKMFKNSLSGLMPSKLIPLVVRFSGIDSSKYVSVITKEERHRLVTVIKGIRLRATGLLELSKAIVTSGGISLKEIDSKTMQSKLIKNLFFAGEVVDLDGTTGGYNLQMCWSTGYVAGQNAVPEIDK